MGQYVYRRSPKLHLKRMSILRHLSQKPSPESERSCVFASAKPVRLERSVFEPRSHRAPAALCVRSRARDRVHAANRHRRQIASCRLGPSRGRTRARLRPARTYRGTGRSRSRSRGSAYPTRAGTRLDLGSYLADRLRPPACQYGVARRKHGPEFGAYQCGTRHRRGRQIRRMGRRDRSADRLAMRSRSCARAGFGRKHSRRCCWGLELTLSPAYCAVGPPSTTSPAPIMKAARGQRERRRLWRCRSVCRADDRMRASHLAPRWSVGAEIARLTKVGSPHIGLNDLRMSS